MLIVGERLMIFEIRLDVFGIELRNGYFCVVTLF